MEDGNWDRAAASCLPKCGLIKENKNGIQVPWNVAIYKNELFICGGTIISEKVVISTAHCFHRETSTKPQLEDISQFKIVAGKYHRDLNATDPLPTQTIQINSIRVIDGYSGAQGKYNGNMVFLILQKKIEFRDHITPICMDFDPKLGRPKSFCAEHS